MAKVAMCDPAIYERGQPVAVIANIPARLIEAVVQEASERAGFKLDWHFAGGRASVLTLGDPDAAAAALRRVLAALPCVMWTCGGDASQIPSQEQQRAHFDSLRAPSVHPKGGESNG